MGGYIGTVGDGITAKIIRDYIEKQGTQEEKEGYKQLNWICSNLNSLAAAPCMPRQLCCGVRRRSLTSMFFLLISIHLVEIDFWT